MSLLKTNNYLDKIIDPNHIVQLAEELRMQGKSIVTLNGSFDLLHAGHLYMIEQASLQGDCLIVALNSDASIKQYKSPTRPLITLKYRMQMMAALEFVDFVTSFEETDPCLFLEKVIPNVHVNGSEYGKDCIEAPIIAKLGARLHIVDLIPGLSTSQIIEKIKQL